MTDHRGWEQQPQYPEQGQQYPQGQPWQPRHYDPRAHQQRMGYQQQPSWQQQGYGRPYPQGQPRQQPDLWAQPARQEPGQDQQPHRRNRSHIPLYAGIAAVVVIAGGGAAYALSGHGSPSSAGSPAASASTAAAEPDTAAGVRAAAQQFYALYSAGQWGAAWAYLAPAARGAVTVATWSAVHDACPGPTAGLRVSSSPSHSRARRLSFPRRSRARWAISPLSPTPGRTPAAGGASACQPAR